MYRFQRLAPLDLTLYSEPSFDDRSGPPLSQGFLLTLINTVAGEYCKPETLDMLSRVEPDGWYHGQLIETVLNEFEDQDVGLPVEIGKNIYYTLRSQFVAMGLKTPTDVITTLPMIWQHVTRGDSGGWHVVERGDGHARIEVQQPYNCQFEQGALVGALEAFDAMDVQIGHGTCMRNGASHCLFDVRWVE